MLKTGLKSCFDQHGQRISCTGTGQDAEYLVGDALPEPRFVFADHGLVRDEYTQLFWPAETDVFDFPLSWPESLQAIVQLNQKRYLGRSDWRMPNRKELRTLIDHGRKNPALSRNDHFSGLRYSWYWTSTTSAMFPEYAWYIHLAGGRMFWGKKTQLAFCRPVCGKSSRILPTGQKHCYDTHGGVVECSGIFALTDIPDYSYNPDKRFHLTETGVEDDMTGLVWYPDPFLPVGKCNWQEALNTVRELAEKTEIAWRLPNINELESIVDCSRHTPALPSNFSLDTVQEIYWSSTTSGFEKDWAYALYMYKGAVGVGYKPTAEYSVWPVTDSVYPE